MLSPVLVAVDPREPSPSTITIIITIYLFFFFVIEVLKHKVHASAGNVHFGLYHFSGH